MNIEKICKVFPVETKRWGFDSLENENIEVRGSKEDLLKIVQILDGMDLCNDNETIGYPIPSEPTMIEIVVQKSGGGYLVISENDRDRIASLTLLKAIEKATRISIKKGGQKC